MSTLLLDRKLALVTGGGRGIGKAICQQFAKNGASVICADQNKEAAEKTISELGSVKHVSVHVDVTSGDFLAQLEEFILKTYERPPSIVVNNAGCVQDASLHKMTEMQWDWTLAVNLKAPFLVTQRFSKAMIDHKVTDGSIINISSIVGKTGNFGQANYASAKAGVMGLTKTVAREMGRFNIRCNAVLPGFIQTDMTDKVPEHLAEIVRQMTPLQRFGQPDEIADACVFLGSNLSRFVTGACLEVTGGLNC